MQPVYLTGRPQGSSDQKNEWLEDAVRKLADASSNNNPVDIASAYTLPAFNVLRTVPLAPTTTDLRDVLCTLISDLARGGSTRTG